MNANIAITSVMLVKIPRSNSLLCIETKGRRVDKRLILRGRKIENMSGESIEKRVLTDHGGRFVVLIIYVAVVILAGGWGYLLGSLGIKSLRPVSLFFLFTLQPTPSGLAVYGMGTLGVGLGIILLLVNYVSQHYDLN